ncbi:MAG: DUF2029 domain-containing protein, partial [Paracoccaceae bacterium]|nr:DUF2029 domain-containing protein [Paracoccaceae bacterium]
MPDITRNSPRPTKRETLQSAVAAALQIMLLLAIVWRAAAFAGLLGPEMDKVFVDFNAIHLAGSMALHGTLLSAYDTHTMFAAEAAAGGGATPMSWAYPPQFDLIAAMLALLPRGLAYLLLMLPTFAAYIFVLHRLASKRFMEAFALTFPALLVTIMTGQNGLMTGAFVGFFALATLQGRSVAGIPLGLMVIKPHLAVGLTVLTLARRRWSAIVVAAAFTLGSGALATLAFGVGVWPAFLTGARQSSAILSQGAYLMFRLTSAYAAIRSFGAPLGLAMAVQIVTAVLSVGLVIYTVRCRWPARLQLGMAVLCTLSISPYIYDYDMAIFGIALALLLPDLLARVSRFEYAAFITVAAVSTGWSAALTVLYGHGGDVSPQEIAAHTVSVSGLTYLALIAFVAVVLRRPLGAKV